MAKEHLFDDLITAIQESVLGANEIAEQQHIQLIDEYFDDQNNPICMEVKLPFYDPKKPGEPIYKPVLIPKLSLVPMSSFKMKEIEVSFEVKFTQLMSDDEEESHQKSKGTKGMFSFQNKSKDSSGDQLAKISIKFERCDPPEGVLRINDHLIKLIP